MLYKYDEPVMCRLWRSSTSALQLEPRQLAVRPPLGSLMGRVPRHHLHSRFSPSRYPFGHVAVYYGRFVSVCLSFILLR